jgi:hypothetical protein
MSEWTAPNQQGTSFLADSDGRIRASVRMEWDGSYRADCGSVGGLFLTREAAERNVSEYLRRERIASARTKAAMMVQRARRACGNEEAR